MAQSEKPRVYLAGQSNEQDNNWKIKFQEIPGFIFYDPATHSDQSSPLTFFPQDLVAVRNSNILIANPGIAPSEATWIEAGYFYALNTKITGEKCPRLIIVWRDDRLPKWSIEFVRMAGILVNSTDAAMEELIKLNSDPGRGR